MSIQWYPGHMAKALRQVSEQLKRIDVVIELLDARIPYSSRNPKIDDLVENKPRLILLNKADMADKEVTKRWREYYEAQGAKTLEINAQDGSGVQHIPDQVNELASDMIEKMKKKGMNPRPVRAMILGIPNVGKSTLINRLAKRKSTKIGDKPGVTKSQQWIKVAKKIELLDTPGILWPKFEEQDVGFRLALTGAIKEEIFDVQDAVVFLLRYLRSSYPEQLQERYQVSIDSDDIVEWFDEIGKRRGCLVSGGNIDYERTAEVIFRDFRSGRLGRMTLEEPPS
ncbi:ribosome biogenesis GTPase YlqF [Texcoconibacillus texcoconensis]|uniref:Ribosome biogenesis GTPase A n=1 Tax=Texcoconibacillus texcoconensis TaxID=1095777 RepID=A0A840QL57_9BACI|nr:ribosome biogenesis GTPase A [Texcoconibacillus texcoconensis]